MFNSQTCSTPQSAGELPDKSQILVFVHLVTKGKVTYCGEVKKKASLP